MSKLPAEEPPFSEICSKLSFPININNYSDIKIYVMPDKKAQHSVSVIMPTYNQGAFVGRALASLFAQTFQSWELIIINDGATDYTEDVIEDYLKDKRVRCYKNNQNRGLGYCLNLGIKNAIYESIAYLPSDDIYYSDHLENLYNTLLTTKDAVLIYSGLYYENTDNYATGLSIKKASGIIPGQTLQLVQVVHKKPICKWVEREEFVTSDLNKMFWNKLQNEGHFISTNRISCEWVNHPQQRHKIINTEYGGGLSRYKQHYSVNEPLKFYTSNSKYIDETAPIQHSKISNGKLKILVVGELGFNPERLLAFENDGHQLYGLWIPNPDIHNAVGPFPFGNIVNLNI